MHDEEQGAILVLALVVLSALITISFIAFNVSSLFTAVSEQEKQAFRTAVSALDGYTKAETGGMTGSDATLARIQNSISVAETYTQSNEEHSFLQAFLPARATAVDFGFPFGEGERGKITPGVWFFDNPGLDHCDLSDEHNCPCTGSGESAYFTGPCFREIDSAFLSAHPDIEPNAIRVNLKVSDESPFEFVLGKMLGRDSVTFSSTATAAFAPRNTIALVDLSRSSYQQTHLPVERGPAPGQLGFNATQALGTEFALKLRSDTPSCNLNACTAANTCHYEGGLVSGGMYDAVYRLRQFTKGTRGILTPFSPTMHYRNDYGCYTICFQLNPDGTCATATQDYLIDNYTNLLQKYYGPEPLSTNLFGLNYMLQTLNKKSVPGDQFSLIGYDHETKVTNRIVPLTAVKDSSLTKLLTATDTTASKEWITKYNLFPRVDAMNNLPLALDKAFWEFHDAPNGSRNVENQVVLFTDGITNCTQASGTCGVDEAFYTASFNESLDYVRQYYEPRGIKVHVILAGAMVQPHTMAIAKGGVCESDDAFREGAAPTDLFVDKDAHGAHSQNLAGATADLTAFFHAPNELYRVARETGGTWCPVRQPCPAGSQAALDNACASKGNGTVTNVSVSGQTVVDDVGRLVCDPSGLTMRQQIQNCMNAILDGNLHVQVE